MSEHQRPMTVSRGIRTQHTVDDYLMRCEDCPLSGQAFSPSDGDTLRRKARVHALTDGHSVSVQTISMAVYQPEEYQQ